MTQNEHVYAISCQPEIAGDAISGENVETIECYAVLNFEAATFSSFRDSNKNFVTEAVADIDDIIKRKRIRLFV